MKKILKLAILFVVFTTSHVFAQPLNPSFEDDNFYRCIIDHLNDQYINNQNNRVAESYNVTDEELTKLTSLTCISYQIKSTKGIEKLSKVAYIDFEDNDFKSINLSNNKQVTYLYVDKDVEVSGYTGTIEREVEIENNDFALSRSVIILGIAGLIIYIIYSIELACVFSRLSEKVWKAWVPILNQIILIKVSSLPMWYFILLFIPIINFFALYKIGAQLCVEFNKSKAVAIVFLLIQPLGLLLLLLSKNQKNVTINNTQVQNIENQIPDIKIQDKPLGYNNPSSFDMMPKPGESINQMGIPEMQGVQPSMMNTQQVPMEQPSMTNIQQVPTEQPSMTNMQQVPVEQPSMTNMQQVPVEQPSMTNMQQVPTEQPSMTNMQQVPIEQPSMTNMQQVPIEQPSMMNTQQVPVEQPSMTNMQQVPVEQPSMTNMQQVPIEQPSMTNMQQVPIEQPNVEQNTTIPHSNDSNVDLEYKLCPRCQSRLRADAKTCFMCGSLVD